jgi:MFS family permease
MAVFGFTWVIPAAVGPLLAGLVMDNADPRWVWYAAGLLGLAATGAFALLQRRVSISAWAVVDERLQVIQRLEEGQVSAEEAATLLQAMKEGQWGITPASSPRRERRQLHIRVSDVTSGAMRVNMTLPLGLVNTVLYSGGRLADGLAGIDLQELEKMVASSAASKSAQAMDTENNERVEVSVE